MDKITLILCLFNLDKLRTGRDNFEKAVFSAIKFFTIGFFGVWWLVDIIQLVRNKYQVRPLDYLKD